MKDDLLREMLQSWAELWRFPEMLGVLIRSPEAGAEELAQALVDGISSPRTPAAVFGGLVEAGEYLVACELLDRPGFRAAFQDESVAGMRSSVERARMEARQELDARTAGLCARARVVDVAARPPKGLEEALTIRRTLAESLVDDWEREIEDAESERAAWVSDQLREAVARSSSPGAELDEWRRSVEQCIQGRRLRTALFLLEGGLQGPPPDDPATVRRPPEWYWRCTPREALDWLSNTQPAPPDFGSWRQATDDEEAGALLGILSQVVDRSGKDTDAPFGEAEQVEEFAAALDQFLGLDADRAYEALWKDGAFETRLYALDDPRLPCLALQGATGVCLRLSCSSATDRPPTNEVEKVALCFGLNNTARNQGNLVFFDTFSLLRLFADRRHRKVNFLRDLGAKLSPLAAIPEDSWQIDFGEQTVGDVRSYAAWLLDVVNVDVEGTELFDMMVYYSGARSELLVLLVRALLETDGKRQAAVTPKRLLEAWRVRAFRRPAAAMLLQPLESEPQLRALLGAALVAAERPGSSFNEADVSLVLEISDAAKAARLDRLALLEKLVELGLLAPGRIAGEFLVPDSGIGHLLFSGVPDLEKFIASALRQFE